MSMGTRHLESSDGAPLCVADSGLTTGTLALVNCRDCHFEIWLERQFPPRTAFPYHHLVSGNCA